jgi:serpin B
VQQPFLDVLRRDFGSALPSVDFTGDPGGALAEINRWVAAHTSNRIPQLLAPGDVGASTRLVLVNAVYLKAQWQDPFDPGDTLPAPFHAPQGNRSVPTMHLTASYPYATVNGYRVLELPYTGGRLAFDILLPAPGRLPALLAAVRDRGLLVALAHLRPQRVRLALPKLRIRTAFELADALQALGMRLAFAAGEADFSGIADRPGELSIQHVAHAAYLRVDEAGTEAAAATGGAISTSAILRRPAIPFTVDHPFAFVLRDRTTSAILLAGVVSQP